MENTGFRGAKLYKIGAAFSSETGTISDWQVVGD